MFVPLLSTRTTNLELSQKQRIILAKRLLHLGRYFSDPSTVYIDVVARKQELPSGSVQYYLSVKLSTPKMTYMTVAISSGFKECVVQASQILAAQLLEDTNQNMDWFTPKATV